MASIPAKTKSTDLPKYSQQSQIVARANQLALRWYAVPAILAGIISLTWFLARGVEAVTITGSQSIARVSMIIVLLQSLIVFPLFYRQGLAYKGLLNKTKRWVIWRDTITLTFTQLVVVSAVMGSMAYAFSLAFKGLTFDPYTASLVVTIVAAVINYGLIQIGLSLSSSTTIVELAFVLIGGVMWAMIVNPTTDWWTVHLSYLGSAESVTPNQFNLTLIISALIMLALTDQVFSGIPKYLQTNKRGITILKWLFVAAAIGLGGVGAFPYTADSILAILHNVSAMSMVLVIFSMIAGLRWWVPNLSREFVATSYLFACMLAVAYVLFVYVRYLNLTAFEIVAFGISFTWLILLLSNLQQPETDLTKKVIDG